MATYALTVSTNALGLGVINGATVRIEKRRVAIADAYPPINNLIQISKATDSSGIATFLLEPDDLTTYHVAKIFDLAGVFIYQKHFTMPPSAANLHDASISTAIGGSLIQFKENGNDLGTPTSVRNVDIVGSGVDATFAGDTVTIDVGGEMATHLAALDPHGQYSLETDVTSALALKVSNSAIGAPSGVAPLDENSTVPEQYLNFMQAGTGAVARTVQDKMRESVSIFDYLSDAQRADVIAGTKLLDVSAAINTALAEIGNNGELFFPPYVYRVSNTITMPSTKHWQKIRGTTSPAGGGGAGVLSKLDFSTLPVNTTAIVTGGRSRIEDIGIFGPGASVGGTGTGVKISYEADLRNVTIQLFNIGVDIVACYYTRLSDVSFRFNSLGLQASAFHNLRLTECAFGGGVIGSRTADQESGNGIHLLGGGECSINGGSIEAFWGAGGYGIRLNGNFLHLNVNDVYFESYGDATHQSGPAILVDGSKSSVNVSGCFAYIYYQDAFVYLADSAFNYSLTSTGNRFSNTSAYNGVIYRLPSNLSYRQSGTVFISGDNLQDIGAAKPLYVSPDILSVLNGQPNVTVYPPRGGFDAGSSVPDHVFVGRPQANYIQDVAPSNPLKGVIYWANGGTWNPCKSDFSPYPVIYDGTSYQQVVKRHALTLANNSNLTLKVNENAVCNTNTSAVTVTLPTSPTDGSTHTIKSLGAANAVTITGGGLNIDSASTYTLPGGTYQAITVTYHAWSNKWLIVSKVA